MYCVAMYKNRVVLFFVINYTHSFIHPSSRLRWIWRLSQEYFVMRQEYILGGIFHHRATHTHLFIYIVNKRLYIFVDFSSSFSSQAGHSREPHHKRPYWQEAVCERRSERLWTPFARYWSTARLRPLTLLIFNLHVRLCFQWCVCEVADVVTVIRSHHQRRAGVPPRGSTTSLLV